MTVVSAMKFNENEGAIIADEQSSNLFANRKYDLATKVHTIIDRDEDNSDGSTIKVVIGGTGVTNILYEISEKSVKYANSTKNITCGNDVIQLCKQIMADTRRQLLDSFIEVNTGWNRKEILSGGRKLADGSTESVTEILIGEYKRSIEEAGKSDIFNNAFVAISFDKFGFKLYELNMGLPKPFLISGPYSTVGSGRDMADGELYSFFEKIPRDERHDIDPIDGIGALLSATEKASMRNIGVGGTPMISAIINGTIVNPNENNTRLSVEIVKAYNSGFLPDQFYKEAIANLIYGSGDFKVVEKVMWEATEKPEELSRMLRGYKA
ncbi:MAG: hypothetical protein ABIG93_02950 [archaeon]|nr:hypothetical protein [Nanoarchaeota archaeon]